MNQWATMAKCEKPKSSAKGIASLPPRSARAIELGAVNFIEKPFEPNAVSSRIFSQFGEPIPA